jgi:hypothetical protein
MLFNLTHFTDASVCCPQLDERRSIGKEIRELFPFTDTLRLGEMGKRNNSGPDANATELVFGKVQRELFNAILDVLNLKIDRERRRTA